MTDSTNVSIKFGGGYEAPWLTVYGTPAEIKAQLIEATGLAAEHYSQRDLVEVIVEASRWARGIYTAAEDLATPPKVTAKEVQAEEPAASNEANSSTMATRAKKAASKGGLAAQAKAAKAEVQGDGPESVLVVDPPLDQLIKTAPSEQFMYELHELRVSEWTDEHTELVKVRLAELKAA